MPSISDNIQSMIDTLTEAKADAAKADKGQQAAGTRLRKTMQTLKADASTLRKQVMDVQKASKQTDQTAEPATAEPATAEPATEATEATAAAS